MSPVRSVTHVPGCSERSEAGWGIAQRFVDERQHAGEIAESAPRGAMYRNELAIRPPENLKRHEVHLTDQGRRLIAEIAHDLRGRDKKKEA